MSRYVYNKETKEFEPEPIKWDIETVIWAMPFFIASALLAVCVSPFVLVASLYGKLKFNEFLFLERLRAAVLALLIMALPSELKSDR